MALTELQLPTKADFYANLKNMASSMNNLMRSWQDAAEFIAKMDVSDLDAIGIAAGQVRTDLVQFRTVLEEMVGFYYGTSTTRTNVPDAVVDKIRMLK